MLNPGDCLGPYEIVSLLGTGGMGEVYRAADSRLRRDVAIKVLPGIYSHNQERLQRFEQEALASARLNHPNIVVVYDVGTDPRGPYVVSELLEGETLRGRLARGRLPVVTAIEYAIQIATGLAAAHAKGIVHRDLKPENIFVTAEPRVKILDFGLAKLTESADAPLSSGAVTTAQLKSEPGVVLGTIGYMSPEQVLGQRVDHRSDIFSVGAILYEMISGRPAFLRESVADTVAALLKDDRSEFVDADVIGPPVLRRIIQRCLDSAPERRFQSAGDLAFSLGTADGSTPGPTRPASPFPLPRRLRVAVAIAVATLLSMLAIAGWVGTQLNRGSIPAELVRFVVPPPEASRIETVSFSPDGKTVAFAATGEHGKQLWLRSLDRVLPQVIRGTEEVTYHFWSHDSRYIAFFAQGKLKRVELSNGTVQTICNATNSRGGSWGRDGTIVFASGTGEGLFRVSAEGGSPTPVTTLSVSRQESAHRWPFFLPDGRHFLFYVRSGRPEHSGIYLGSLDATEPRRLTAAVSNPAYVSPGYLVFLRDGALFAQPFDADRLTLSGDAQPIVNGVTYDATIMRAEFATAGSGVLAYRPGGIRNLELRWFDRGGKPLRVIGSPAGYANITLAPDDTRVAAACWDATGTSDICLLNGDRTAGSRLTFASSSESHPFWSPDGRSIVFASDREGFYNIYKKSATGSGGEEMLLSSNAAKYPTDWSRDGRFLVYDSVDAVTRLDIWVLPLFGDRKPVPFLKTEFDEWIGEISPNGKWMAYVSNESGRYEVYVQSFPSGGGKWQVSTGGGLHPRWSDAELFYIAADQKVMAVTVQPGSDFRAGRPATLFQAPSPNVFATRAPYDVTRDGTRFLMAVEPDDQSSAPVTVILNWPALLPR